MRQRDPDSREDQDDSPIIGLPALQGLLLLIGLVGVVLHAFPVRMAHDSQSWPIFDLTTLAWAALVAVSAVLPDVSEITWGGFSLKKQKLQEASKTLETSLDNLANLVQNWSTSSAMYIEMMRRGQPELLETKDKIYGDYVRDRMGEAYEMLATKRGETVRLGLWLYSADKNSIEFAAGFRLKPHQVSFKPGEGMIGKAFVENRHFNEADIANVPSYKPSRIGQAPPYRGVLCEPVRWKGSPIGMITVDRSSAGNFDYVSEQVTQGLASQCALAVKIYEDTLSS